MKDLPSQIRYLDTVLLKVFGIDSIVDYETEISVNTLKDKNGFLDAINNEVDNLKTYFPAREFSLHKSDGKIKTEKQAFSFLLKCLTLAKVPHDVVNRKNVMHVRLISENFVLKEYIEKMKSVNQNSEFRHTDVDGHNETATQTNDSKTLINLDGGVSEKMIMIDEQEYLQSVVDKNRTETSNVLMSSFIDSKKVISCESFRHSFKNLRVDAELLNDQVQTIESTNNFLNAMIENVPFYLQIGGMSIFKGYFKFGQPLLPDNVYLPTRYLIYNKVELVIDLPDDVCQRFANNLVLKVVIDTIWFKPKIRRKLESVKFHFTLNVKDCQGNDVAIRCMNGTATIAYYSTPEQAIGTNEFELPDHVSVENLHHHGLDLAILRNHNSNDNAICAIKYMVSRKLDIVGIDTEQVYKSQSYQVEKDQIILSFSLLRMSDTRSHIRVKLPKKVSDPEFRLVFLTPHQKEIESYNLDYDYDDDTDMYHINRYTIDNMLQAHTAIQCILELRINKTEFESNPFMDVNVIDIEYYWETRPRRDLLSYRKLFDFVEKFSTPKAINILIRALKNTNPHFNSKALDDEKGRFQKIRKEERIEKREKKIKSSSKKNINRATKDRPGRNGTHTKRGGRARARRA